MRNQSGSSGGSGRKKTGSRRRGKRGGRGRGAKGAAHPHARSHAPTPTRHSSHPTTRNAMVATRAWLLKEYGPFCAYCGGRFKPDKMTLDHVAPRRGQIAYDRRDNLVLACGPCNMAKRDQSPLAFMLGLRSRAMNLVRYGAHLSDGLVEMARSLVPGHLLPKAGEKRRVKYALEEPPDPDEESPYK